jgi:hypothetical protein
MEAITPSGLTQARQALGTDIFFDLLKISQAKHFEKHHEIITYKGRNLYAIDGSNLNLTSCKTLANVFGRPSSTGTKQSLPQASFTALELVNSSWIVDYKLEKCDASELTQAKSLVANHLGASDLLLADRLYFDTQWYASLIKDETDFLFRVNCDRYKSCTLESQNQIKQQRLSQANVDLVVDLRIKGGPETIPVRYIEIKREHCSTLYFMTTLSAAELNLLEASDLYRMRWEIETDFRFFKGQDHLPVVASRTEETVRQEVAMRVLAHNSLRFVQSEACVKARKDQLPKQKQRNLKVTKTPKWKPKSSFHSFGLRPVDLQYNKSLSIVTGYIFMLISSDRNLVEEELSILAKIANSEIRVMPNRSYPRYGKKFNKGKRQKGNVKAQRQRHYARKQVQDRET